MLGRVSQDTISGGIADIGAFTTDPEFYAYGMMWALIVGGVWQIVASHKELNVSATHSIIGAIVGFSMAFKGKGAVIWAQKQVVCTGPLTGFNTDGRPAGAFTTFAGKSLGAAYSVHIQDFYNATTGGAIYPSSAVGAANAAAKLTSIMPIKNGNYQNVPHSAETWAAAWTVALCGPTTNMTGVCANPTMNSIGGPSAAGAFNPISGAYIVNATGYPFGSLIFTLKTAGETFNCANPLVCPILASAALPIMPGSFYYGSAAGYCTTASNSALPFPPYKGVLIIVLSWFFSPVLTGIASAILFSLSRLLVLRSPNAYKRSFLVLPPMAFLTFWVNIYFVLTKGAAKVLSRDAEGWTTVRAAWISAACAGGVSFFSAVVIIPLMRFNINTFYQKRDEDEAAAKEAALEEGNKPAPEEATVDVDAVESMESPAVELTGAAAKMAKMRAYMKQARNAAMHGMEVNIHSIVEEDELVASIHANAELFDEKAEHVFSYMQVFSAICVIFAHGAGEVGYMSGPLGAIFLIVRSGNLVSSSAPCTWTVLVGAFGLIIGLGTYGYQVTRAVGTRMAKLTPSRGFAAELSTSMIIMIASQYGLPTSSSQCITGGIIGIALCEGKGGLNFKFLFETFMSWVWTMVFVALITAFLFSQGAYAPSAQMARTIGYYEESLSVRSNLILTNYQAMIKASGYNTGSSSDQFAVYLSNTIANTAPGQYYSYNQPPPGFYPGNKAPTIQSPAPWQMVGYLDTALALVQMSVKPDTTAGVNMCGNAGAPSTTQWSATSTKFPWSQLALGAGVTDITKSVLANTTFGPCTLAVSSQPSAITLTKANFLGPSPYALTQQWYETKAGALVTQYNGTVSRLFSNTFGDVTLDQVKNWKTCQQAPCNQVYNPNAYYMG